MRRPAAVSRDRRASCRRVIGREARAQFLAGEGRLPDAVVACVGGGSNAIGIFHGFLDDADVRLIGVEAAGAASLGMPARSRAAGCAARRALVVLADEDGQIVEAHSISAGLDYPGVGPEHAFLRDTGRAEYRVATDEEALAAFRDLARTEGIIPALEPAHALARARDLDAELILVGLSGRGDKDLAEALARLGWSSTQTRRPASNPSICRGSSSAGAIRRALRGTPRSSAVAHTLCSPSKPVQ